MKTRLGFVSNSSSSSFIVPSEYFSAKGFIMAEQTAKRNCWDMYLNSTGDIVTFNTSMDNFDMKEYLFDIGIPYEAMENR